MKKQLLSLLCLLMGLTASAQTVDGRNFSIDGFAAYAGTPGTNHYLAGGTTGGQGGKVVKADNFSQLQAYLQSTQPYIILVDHDINTGITCYINNTQNARNICDKQDGSEGTKTTFAERIMVSPNKTLIGITNDKGEAPLFSRISFVMQCTSNVIIRNCRFTMLDAPIAKPGKELSIIAWRDGAEKAVGDPDCIGIQADNTSASKDFGGHIWIDHCEFFNGNATHKDRYDGLLDCKNNVQWLTFSYNLFHNHMKACLWGKGNSDIYTNCRTISAHHNYFKDINGSRLPLQRGGNVHYMNNYQENCADGWDLRAQAVSYADACYFKDSKAPILPDGGESGKLTINKAEGYGIIYDNCNRVITSPADGISFVNDPAKHDSQYNLATFDCIGTWVPTETWADYFVNNHDKAADVPDICKKYSGAGKITIWTGVVPAPSITDFAEAVASQRSMGDTAVYDENGNKITKVDTAIESVQVSNSTTYDCYDLQGRRITAPAKGQMYIMNGKKLIR